MGLGIFPQPLLGALVLVPGDVARMSLGQQCVPLVGWESPTTVTPVAARAGAGPAVEEGAGVPRVMQHLQHSRMDQRSPDQFATPAAPRQGRGAPDSRPPRGTPRRTRRGNNRPCSRKYLTVAEAEPVRS